MSKLENFRLKVFRAVAHHLNFRKAADQLFLTQPAVTLQIQALENELGVRLFDRTGGHVSLTPQGKLLLRHANKLAAIAAQAERELGRSHQAVSGELSLGVSTTIAQYVLPKLLGAFLAEHPQVQFSFESGNTAEIVHLLLGGEVSAGLIEGPAQARGIRTEPFMEDELVLIAPRDFSLSRISRAQLQKLSLLMREQGSGSRRVVETSLERAGLKLKCFQKVMDLDSTEAIKSAVEASLGVGFVSRWAVSKELELGTLQIVEVGDLRITRHFTLITRTGPIPQGPTDALRIFALERARLFSSLAQKPHHPKASRR